MKTPYVDDSDMTEIIIQPDGRIYAFGLSPEVAAVLHELDLAHQFAAPAPEKSDGTITQTVYNVPGGTHGEG